MSLMISNPEAFASYIERVVNNAHCSYMDAILDFCEKRQLDPAHIKPFINDKIKLALLREGRALHLLARDANELPLD